MSEKIESTDAPTDLTILRNYSMPGAKIYIGNKNWEVEDEVIEKDLLEALKPIFLCDLTNMRAVGLDPKKLASVSKTLKIEYSSYDWSVADVKDIDILKPEPAVEVEQGKSTRYKGKLLTEVIDESNLPGPVKKSLVEIVEMLENYNEESEDE